MEYEGKYDFSDGRILLACMDEGREAIVFQLPERCLDAPSEVIDLHEVSWGDFVCAKICCNDLKATAREPAPDKAESKPVI